MKKNTLKNYYDLIVPPDLKDNEFVRLIAFKNKENSSPQQKTFYIKTFDEFQKIIAKYKYNWDLFVSTSTVRGCNGGTAEKLYRRKVLFFDFDKKDYPQFERVEDFTSHIKRKLPTLFNHAIVGSGNGIHVYVATQPTSDIKRITHINKESAKILGADLKAVLPTQIVRIPTSLNHKREEPRPVSVITNTFGTVHFKPYKLNKLESILSFANKNQVIDEKLSQTPIQEYKQFSKYYCIEKMLAEGCKLGERNFALGRISKYLQMRGYLQEQALNIIKEWNSRCYPPKNIDEVTTDFKRYWNGSYKLLGCTLVDTRHQKILSNYCDRYQCKTIQNGEEKVLIDSKEFEMDNHLLQPRVMRKLSGNHYLIMSILHINEQGLSFEQLNRELMNKKTKKPCLSYNTLKKVLKDLVEGKCISEYNKFYKLIDIKNYGLGYTRFYYSATILLINKIITQQEYLVYLCLVRRLRNGDNATYDSLSEDLNMDRSNIGKYIKSLHNAQILKIEKTYSNKGLLCNRYILVA